MFPQCARRDDEKGIGGVSIIESPYRSGIGFNLGDKIGSIVILPAPNNGDVGVMPSPATGIVNVLVAGNQGTINIINFINKNDSEYAGKNQTQIFANSNVVNGSSTAYTVPASTVFYLSWWRHTGYSTSGTGNARLRKDNGSGAKVDINFVNLPANNMNDISQSSQIMPIKLVAGEFIETYSSANGVGSDGTISGWEESV